MSQRFKSIRDEMEWMSVEQAGPAAIETFDRILATGESVSMAALLATRRPPSGGVNEQIVQRNAGSLEQQFEGCGPMLDLYRKNYKAQTGEELPSTAVVNRGLAAYPGDPGCIMTHKHSLADVQRVAKERNHQVEGDWENHPFQQAPVVQSCRINKVAMERLKSEYRHEKEEYCRIPEQDLEAEITMNHTKVVTPDEMMNAAKSVGEINKRVFGRDVEV